MKITMKKPQWLQHLKGSQKLLGLVALVGVLLIMMSPEFVALGLLGDAAFFDMLVLVLTLQMHQLIVRVWQRCVALVTRGAWAFQVLTSVTRSLFQRVSSAVWLRLFRRLPIDSPRRHEHTKACPTIFPTMKTKTSIQLIAIVFLFGTVAGHAQSSAKGTVLIKEDFSGGEKRAQPQQWGGGLTWSIPETWEIRDGVIACIFDGKAHPGKAHGRSLDPRFKAHNVRVSYRIKFEGEDAKLAMLINATFKPGKPDGVLWHIGDVVTRITKPEARDDVSIGERDFTRDVNHPALKGRKLDPAVLEKPEGTYGSVYGIPGASTNKKIGLITGQWYQFVVESIGTKWTLWVDGKETLSLDLKRSDVEKETVNFIGFGPFLLDYILIEEMPR
ncbi:MAG: hypothetical protein RL693_2239 [Verrucomicrobiota bacterium]|jgi:hypothetical protein